VSVRFEAHPTARLNGTAIQTTFLQIAFNIISPLL
jgi:hypothetical protein